MRIEKYEDRIYIYLVENAEIFRTVNVRGESAAENKYVYIFFDYNAENQVVGIEILKI